MMEIDSDDDFPEYDYDDDLYDYEYEIPYIYINDEFEIDDFDSDGGDLHMFDDEIHYENTWDIDNYTDTSNNDPDEIYNDSDDVSTPDNGFLDSIENDCDYNEDGEIDNESVVISKTNDLNDGSYVNLNGSEAENSNKRIRLATEEKIVIEESVKPQEVAQLGYLMKIEGPSKFKRNSVLENSTPESFVENADSTLIPDKENISAFKNNISENEAISVNLNNNLRVETESLNVSPNGPISVHQQESVREYFCEETKSQNKVNVLPLVKEANLTLNCNENGSDLIKSDPMSNETKLTEPIKIDLEKSTQEYFVENADNSLMPDQENILGLRDKISENEAISVNFENNMRVEAAINETESLSVSPNDSISVHQQESVREYFCEETKNEDKLNAFPLLKEPSLNLNCNVNGSDLIKSDSLPSKSELKEPIKIERNDLIIKAILKSFKDANEYSIAIGVINSGQVYQLKDLSPSSSEYRSLKNKFDTCMRSGTQSQCKGYVVQKIEEIICPYLLAQFEIKSKKKMRETVHYEDVYHGTQKSNIPLICTNNFDWRKCGTHVGTKFGKGISFAKYATYATFYPKKEETPRAMIFTRIMFVAKQLGNTHMAVPYEGYDTSINRKGEVIVKYDDAEFCPLYVIYYC